MEAGGGLEEAPNTEPRNRALLWQLLELGMQPPAISLCLPQVSQAPALCQEMPRSKTAQLPSPKELAVRPNRQKRSPSREASHISPVLVQVSRVRVGALRGEGNVPEPNRAVVTRSIHRHNCIEVFT